MAVSVDDRRLKLSNEEGTEGVLVGCRCLDCGVCVFGPSTFCQSCTSSRLEAVELSQRGTLYSYTVVRVPPQGWPGAVPYVLGQIELPEGPQVLAEVIDWKRSEPLLQHVQLADVQIGDVVVSHKNIVVDATEQILPFRALDHQEGGDSAKLTALVDALNALKVPNSDAIDIIKNIERSGKLHGRLIIE